MGKLIGGRGGVGVGVHSYLRCSEAEASRSLVLAGQSASLSQLVSRSQSVRDIT